MTDPKTDAVLLPLEPCGHAIVDRADVPLILTASRGWRQCRRKPPRIRAWSYVPKGKPGGTDGMVFLEWLLTDRQRGEFVRFLNGNPLDCRRANLQLVRPRRESFVHDPWSQGRIPQGHDVDDLRNFLRS